MKMGWCIDSLLKADFFVIFFTHASNYILLCRRTFYFRNLKCKKYFKYLSLIEIMLKNGKFDGI